MFRRLRQLFAPKAAPSPKGPLATVAWNALGSSGELPLWATDPRRARAVDGEIRFALGGEHTYLSSAPGGVTTPIVGTPLELEPGAEYVLSFDAPQVEGTASLWVIEFADGEKLCHHSTPMSPGRSTLRWRTHSAHQHATIAIRLRGDGSLRPTSGRLEKTRPSLCPLARDSALRTGPEGAFLDYSIFFDPAGYRDYSTKHHDFYKGRTADWYEEIATRFGHCKSVLDLGAGPGLLLDALKRAGVGEVLGLERDPIYCAMARAAARPVTPHDLNLPFPFVPAGHFEAAIAHHTLDYLAPIAVRGLLRESVRVLAPGAVFWALARRGGQATGDATRTAAFSASFFEGALGEAGFEAIQISERGNSWELRAIAPAERFERASLSTEVRSGGAQIAMAWASGGEGAITLSLESGELHSEIAISGAGRILFDDEAIHEVGDALDAGEPTTAFGLAVRIHRPHSAAPELEIATWRDGQLACQGQRRLQHSVHRVAMRMGKKPESRGFRVEHFDVWQPALVDVLGPASGFLELAEPGAALRVFEELAANRALGLAFVGAAADLGQAAGFSIASIDPSSAAGSWHSIVRLEELPRGFDGDGIYRANQLEVLWQSGRLSGVDLRSASETPRQVIEWINSRGVPVVVNLEDAADGADGLLAEVPRLALVCAGSSRAAWRAFVAANTNHFGIVVAAESLGELGELLEQFPDQWMLGGPNPASLGAELDRHVACLDHRVAIRSENLRFVAERVTRSRWQRMQRGETYFPPLPRDEEDCRTEGFEIVEPGGIPLEEFDDAKAFWAGYGVRSWYQAPKPWAGTISQCVLDAKATSVLEFGCNVGRNLAAIAESAPGVALVGIDINAEAIAFGREKTGLDLRVADEAGLAGFGDGEFDVVFTVSVLDHISDIREVAPQLLRVARQRAVFLEPRLPIEGHVLRHFDHKHLSIRPTTGSSYSWHLEKYLRHPRVRRIEQRPLYLHPAALGPYYWSYTVIMDPPDEVR